MFGSRKFNGQKYLHFWISSRPDSENSTNSNINRSRPFRRTDSNSCKSVCVSSRRLTLFSLHMKLVITDQKTQKRRVVSSSKIFGLNVVTLQGSVRRRGRGTPMNFGQVCTGSYSRRRQTRTDIIFYKTQVWKLCDLLQVEKN